MENYRLQKSKLFSMCDTAIINADDNNAVYMINACKCPVITYSIKDDHAQYVAKNINFKSEGVDFELLGTGVIGRVMLKMPGEFSVYNALAAGSCAIELGIDVKTVTDALSTIAGVKGRAEKVPAGSDYTVIIDYAHNPESLYNICKTYNQQKTGRLVTLFGCGGDRDRTKRPEMGRIAAENSDFVIVTSDNPRSEDPAAIINDITAGMQDSDTPRVVIENRIEAIRYAVQNARPGDIILLAGKGHETYQVLNTGKIHLDEREIVAQAVQDYEDKE